MADLETKGERKDGRAIIDRVVRRLVNSGMPVDRAQQKARETRISEERKGR